MTTPKKYRKKPVTVEASQWWEAGDHDEVGLYRHPPVDPITGDISAADDAILMGEMRHSEVPERFRRETCDALMDDHGWIDTLEGGHTVCPGDYIIRGVQGEFYPCKPDIFAATYEEAEGMTTNIDRAAEVIADALRPALSIADGIGYDLARAQAAAGVIAPDLPEPHTFPNGEREWDILDGWVNLDTDGTITVVYDERDEDDIAAGAEIASGELVFTKPVAARDLVLAFLAATNHAQREETNE